MEADFNFFLITKKAEAGLITVEIGSPFEEEIAGCKGLSKGDFIDYASLDLVIFLQLGRREPFPAHTEGIALSALAPALLRSPISSCPPVLGLFFIFPSPFSGVGSISAPSPLTR